MIALSAHFQLTLTFVMHRHAPWQKMEGGEQVPLHQACCCSEAVQQPATAAPQSILLAMMQKLATYRMSRQLEHLQDEK